MLLCEFPSKGWSIGLRWSGHLVMTPFMLRHIRNCRRCYYYYY